MLCGVIICGKKFLVVNYDDTSTKLWQVYTAQFFVWIISVLYGQVRTGGVTKNGGKNFRKLFTVSTLKALQAVV